MAISPTERTNTMSEIIITIDARNSNLIVCDTCTSNYLTLTCVQNFEESFTMEPGGGITIKDRVELYEPWNNHIACGKADCAGPSDAHIRAIKHLLPGVVWAAKVRDTGAMEMDALKSQPKGVHWTKESPLMCGDCGGTITSVSYEEHSSMMEYQDHDIAIMAPLDPPYEITSVFACNSCREEISNDHRDYIVTNLN